MGIKGVNMATRPTLTQAIEEKPNKASVYNNNNDAILDYVDDVASEANTDIAAMQQSITNFSNNNIVVETEVKQCRVTDSGSYVFSEENGDDVPSSTTVYFDKYECSDEALPNQLYLIVGRNVSSTKTKTDYIPYEASNEYWIKKTYQNYQQSNLIDYECGGRIHLYVSRNYGSSDYYSDIKRTFQIMLPSELNYSNWSADIMITPPAIFSPFYNVPNKFVSVPSGTNTPTSQVTLHSGVWSYNGSMNSTNYPLGFATLTVYIPKLTAGYNCTLHWHAKANMVGWT